MEWDENTSAMFGVSTEGHRPGIAELKNLKEKTSIDALAIEVEALAVKVAALTARIAERDEQLARLRREMDALRDALQYGVDDTVEPSETGQYIARAIREAEVAR